MNQEEKGLEDVSQIRCMRVHLQECEELRRWEMAPLVSGFISCPISPYLQSWSMGCETFLLGLSVWAQAEWDHRRAKHHTPAHTAPPPYSVNMKRRTYIDQSQGHRSLEDEPIRGLIHKLIASTHKCMFFHTIAHKNVVNDCNIQQAVNCGWKITFHITTAPY